MTYPKIQSAKVIDAHTLLIEFNNNEAKQYDITPLLDREMFAPLQNYALFKSVQVEWGGYAVAWNSDIDIRESATHLRRDIAVWSW